MSKSSSHYSHISAAILAGGLGTRLRSVLQDLPKVLAEVLNRPFLTFLFDQLLYAGLRSLVLCTGYKGEEVRKQLGHAYGSLNLLYSQEDAPLGTGGALRLALPHLSSDTVLVMNGDSYVNADLRAFLNWFSLNDLSAALVLNKMTDTSRYGRVILDENGAIQSFEEKGGKANTGWINSGVYLFRKKLLQAIPRGRHYSLEREFFPSLLAKGLYGYPCQGEFLDIGTPDSYAEAEHFFQKMRQLS